MICIAVIKGFNQPEADGSDKAVSADKTITPNASLLGEKNLLGNMQSITSLKQTGLSGVFSGQSVSSIGLSYFYNLPV